MGTGHYIVISVSVVLLTFTLWMELRRRNKRYLLLRLAASFIAVASLACIALPLTFNRTVTSTGEAIITTDGYNKDSVSLFSENKNIPTYTFDEFASAEKNNYKTLHVFGYGLSADELKALHNRPVVFHPSVIGTGITSINWKQILQKGETLRLQGIFTNKSAAPVKLILNGLNTILDSINIQPNSEQQFELNTVPKESGKAVYNITAVANDKIIEDEPVPVEVAQPDSLKVLILAASPDFENRFLKNWLSQNGCQVVVRTETSKDKYEREFLNMPSVSFDHITSPLLDKFDVIISDASEFSVLSKGEQNIIQSKIENGLGLIIKTDTALSSSFYSSYFPVYSQPSKQLAISLRLVEGNILHSLPSEQPLYIKAQPGTQALATDSASQISVNSAIYGIGKIIVTTLNNTYNWMLTDNKESYYSFWSALIEKATKKKGVMENVSFSPVVPRINQLLNAKFSNTGNSAPQPTIGESPLYLKQNDDLPFNWEGKYWPVQAGWQVVNTQTNTSNLYVYNANDWKYVTATEKLQATKQYVLQQNNLSASTEALNSTERVPFPKTYFFIAFILSCIFLWVEKKFNG